MRPRRRYIWPMTAETRTPAEPSSFLKLALELGPLVVFFLVFRYGRELLDIGPLHDLMARATGEAALASASGPLFVATAAFMVAIAASLAASWWLTRRLPRMAVVTGVVVAVFGGLTLWLQDETFIKMKPTIVNGLFAIALGIGLMQGRSYIKYLMGEAIPMDDRGWMIFTRRWAVFFLFMALLNEAVWRTQTTEFWVSFKTFGNLPLTMGFTALQLPLLRRHMIEERG
ncbi:septation protein A [Limibaculum sp. FT325]|uniref:septation protein A n=1 Tax=Thermohalobaculum sediminis TaxID=2939436 RepID=UPI0020C160F7|nr:septation protein A [Limibaculum sediminis]MCL5776456.1 septation protein A [Limibaculum sediminis]